MDRLPKAITVLTGAGISAESGIPTFRGPDGLWQGHDPQQLATPQAFALDPELVWQFYDWRRGLVIANQPNDAHNVLAEIEESVSPFTIITQNVDGYHIAAGSKNVIELHGSLWRLKCTHCSQRWEDRRHPLPDLPVSCPSCKALARPDVVWFGETLDPTILDAAITQSQQSHIFLSIGTSSVVYPAAELPILARQHGAYTIEINPLKTPISDLMHEVIRGPAAIELRRWWKEGYQKLLDTN
jgi:NAD-dependent deacetylase